MWKGKGIIYTGLPLGIHSKGLSDLRARINIPSETLGQLSNSLFFFLVCVDVFIGLGLLSGDDIYSEQLWLFNFDPMTMRLQSLVGGKSVLSIFLCTSHSSKQWEVSGITITLLRFNLLGERDVHF